MIKAIDIYDMDGTLVDSSHRYRTMPCGTRIDLDYWIANEHRVMGDTLLPQVDLFREQVADPSRFTIIATARIWCDLTAEFVNLHDIEPNAFVARRDRDDTRGGAELKISYVKRLLNLKQFAGVEEIHVYEDNATYLDKIVTAFDGIGHFYPSNQGH